MKILHAGNLFFGHFVTLLPHYFWNDPSTDLAKKKTEALVTGTDRAGMTFLKSIFLFCCETETSFSILQLQMTQKIAH